MGRAALPLRVLKGSGNTLARNSGKEFKALSTDFLCLGNTNMNMHHFCQIEAYGK
jgi:hypothetical protein